MSAFITLGNAARHLAGEDGTPEEIAMFASLLASEADALHTVKDWTEHCTGLPGGISYYRPAAQWRIPRIRFVAWCKANGYRAVSAHDAVSNTAGEVPETDFDIPAQREKAILDAIWRHGWPPLSIPRSGVKTLKDECMQNAKLFTDSAFDRAWRALTDSRKARTARHEQYAKRYK